MTISEELQEANEWVESTIKLMKMGKEAQKISDKKKMMETIDETFKKFKPKSIFIINFCNELKNSVEENMKTQKQSNVKKNKLRQKQ